MLSILIPVYNFDVRDLVKELHYQASYENIQFEIILLDDGSEEEYKSVNSGLGNLNNVLYKEEPINLGRSKIRNKLASIASYNHLIFMDCDSGITNADYIKNYVKLVDNYPIVCGGTVYSSSSKVPDTQKLHWLHGLKREQWPAKVRNQEPNKSFHTNNFLISKQLLQTIGFNEKIIGYGHEDTLFGYELQKRGVAIFHVDNPVMHIGLESNEEFLRKTREGIKNLKRIVRINGQEKIARDITILSYYNKLKTFRLIKPIEYFYKRYEHILRRNLLGHKPKLFVFDLYKLGYLCSINSEV